MTPEAVLGAVYSPCLTSLGEADSYTGGLNAHLYCLVGHDGEDYMFAYLFTTFRVSLRPFYVDRSWFRQALAQGRIVRVF